ncbi:MAG: SpoIIE family protein phosphatase [Thermoflexibacter sp.]|nr:SpoIIE family protein phosphatase [Thermoflexibacter sp.]
MLSKDQLLANYLQSMIYQDYLDYATMGHQVSSFLTNYIPNSTIFLLTINHKKEYCTIEYAKDESLIANKIYYKNDEIYQWWSKKNAYLFELPIQSKFINSLITNDLNLLEGLYLPFYEENDLKGFFLIFSSSLSPYKENLIMLHPSLSHSFLTLFQKFSLKKRVSELEAMNNALEMSQQALHENAVNFIKIHKKLTNSLEYAKKMQYAILPSNRFMDSIFSEHFIIYEPKDIVSGDFYWCSQLDYTFLALVDCTGHGVPGAFMSMIGNTLLNEIINIKRYTDPAMILELLHKGIREVLKQDETNNSDGMDIGLCRFERNEDFQLKLTFSGAKSILFIQTQGELIRVRGNRKSIGGIHFKEKITFDNEVFDISDGDRIYLTTDGFIDAANWRRERLGIERFQRILRENMDLPMAIQKEKLTQFLSDYQKNTPQRDDITVVGVRV